ncbi:hypothetical protein [Thermococcus sp. Bubb.Bath]|uniref:hypothetical protein n=1 Tax=Thermococcus sp. Bubb.Bath TaxID=1638242 RepID=UPI00143C7206|nr:hypothetical protein [Thermococcus sp. Bubb.Bath]NJF24722.1 hypothetical protein [Thermococcus sp. Bubb.Bath]
MKVGELLEMVDETIAELRIAAVSNQQRSFETPYTSMEFTQRAIEIDEDLRDLEKIREHLNTLDPEEDAEKHLGTEGLEKLVKMLELLKRSEAHVY